MQEQASQNTRTPPIATQYSENGCAHRSLTSQMKVVLIRKLSGSLVCLAYFIWLISDGCFYNQALADVRSTCAGIKWLCYNHISQIPEPLTCMNSWGGFLLRYAMGHPTVETEVTRLTAHAQEISSRAGTELVSLSPGSVTHLRTAMTVQTRKTVPRQCVTSFSSVVWMVWTVVAASVSLASIGKV